MRRGLTVSLVCVIIFVLPSGAARATAAITGTVTDIDGAAIANAAVTIAAPDQPPLTDTTNGAGAYSITPAGAGPFSVGVQAAGFRARSVSGKAGGEVVDFALDGPALTTLGVSAAAVNGMAADAASGIFYAFSHSGPELYRTIDYGGSWQIVTMGYDDGLAGLGNNGSAIATSSVPGEIAVFRAGFLGSSPTPYRTVSYSTDYGLTWRTIDGLVGINESVGARIRTLHWAHANGSAGTDNVMMFAERDAGVWEVARADMNAATPVFTNEAADPFGAAGSLFDVADSANGSFVGRISASGDLSFTPLTASDPITFGAAVATSLPNPPQIFRLGGAVQANGPPDGVLVVGRASAPLDGIMLTKSTPDFGVDSTLSAPTSLGPGCGSPDSFLGGAVEPTTTGTSGAAQEAGCWVRTNGAGSLTVTNLVAPIPADADLAFDSDWGPSGNRVGLIASGAGGPLKSADIDGNGVPIFDPNSDAQPGTAISSLGVSRDGYHGANIDDMAYGATDQELSIASGSGLTIASTDGGATFTHVLPISWSQRTTDWWQGETHSWLLWGFGQASPGNTRMLTGFADWNGQTASTHNVDGSMPADLFGTSSVVSIEGVPNQDMVFLGLSTGLVRATISATNPGDPAVLSAPFDLTPAIDAIDPQQSLYSPNRLAYCPATSINPSIADTLFVATGEPGPAGQDQKGALLRITGASTSIPTAQVIDSIPHDIDGTMVNDVRASCSTGVVYAGGWPGPLSGTGFFRSDDAGMTFTQFTVPDMGPIMSVAVNPLDANDVKAGDPRGVLAQSLNGGLDWTRIGDASTSREVSVFDIEYPPAGTTLSSLARSAATSSATAAVGTGSGAFAGDLSVASGIIAVSRFGSSWLGEQLTGLVSDAHPSMVMSPSSGGIHAVSHRGNGLYRSTHSFGVWSSATQIPGTKAGDDHPSLARSSSGKLYLAFQRPTGGPGVYVMARSTSGAWGAPRRVSTSASDTLPSVALTGSTPSMHVAFLRPGGTTPGVYTVSKAGGTWTGPSKVPGTYGPDTSASFGGPSLASDAAGRLHLAFARAAGNKGIYFAKRSTGPWSSLRRLTTVAGDTQPSLVVDSTGADRLVFRRITSTPSLYAMRGTASWSIERIPRTHSYDAAPDLSVVGTTLRLTFRRTGGTARGIYYDGRGSAGWLSAPQRRSSDPADANPVIRADNSGHVTIVFERK